MEFLRLLEEIRTGWLNGIMLAVTYLGSEIIFLAVALIFFWCVDKTRGYYLMSVGFVGTILNQFLKLYCRIPRPWVQDPQFTIVEEARAGADGYSFPSGHTQSAVGTYGSIAYTSRNRWVQVLCVAVAALVAFSRMYLGVHTPMDVGVSVVIGIILIFALRPLFFKESGKYIPRMLGFMTALAVGFLLYVEFCPFPEEMDGENLASGMKNAYTLLGALLGMVVVYIVDERWLHFPIKAIWWAQLLKLILGIALVLGVKTVLTQPMTALFGFYWGRLVRYFLTVVVAGSLWPLTFSWFSKLGNKS